MAKRKYVKRSDYWNKFESGKAPLEDAINDLNKSSLPSSSGESYYVSTSQASRYTHRDGDSPLTSSMERYIHRSSTSNRYENISKGILPFEFSEDGVSVREAIELCQKAYANVAVFRNSVDIMSEFANSDLYLEGGTSASRNFIDKWLDKINCWNLKDQYFREYYRSGNIFLYRVDGKFNVEDYKKFKTVYGSNSLDPGSVPIKYILLNPYDIIHERSSNYDSASYKKVLSKYEIERLRNPQTARDKEIFNSLDRDARKKIKEGFSQDDGVQMKLEANRLSFSFYKKQDYEPFAIPFGYPVLDDINWKLELKKIDQAISRTIENVILLITMGAKEDDGGVNPENLHAMQELFANESVGRVLVADYTTKANFVIPDVNKVLGPDKYKIVNDDIKEGLQNIVVGDERYSNAQVKTQIFLERLKEARNAFLNDFLQPQIKMVCKNLGFRKYPVAKFQEIDIKDEVQLQRVATRLIELGILTPDQGISAIKTGVYPSDEDLRSGQEKYSKEREEGWWNPLVGGVPLVEPPGAEEERELKEKMSKKAGSETNSPAEPQSINNVPNESGRPAGTSGIPQENKRVASAFYSKEDIKNTVYSAEKLKDFVKQRLKAKESIKRFSKKHSALVDALCESVILSSESEKWESVASACVDDFNEIEGLVPLPQVHEVSEEHGLGIYPSAILYHSREK